jgi:hypothetical protein
LPENWSRAHEEVGDGYIISAGTRAYAPNFCIQPLNGHNIGITKRHSTSLATLLLPFNQLSANWTSSSVDRFFMVVFTVTFMDG